MGDRLTNIKNDFFTWVTFKRTALTSGSKSEPAELKMRTALNKAALIPESCWNTIKKTATRRGLKAHGRRRSPKLDFIDNSTLTRASSSAISLSMLYWGPRSHCIDFFPSSLWPVISIFKNVKVLNNKQQSKPGKFKKLLEIQKQLRQQIEKSVTLKHYHHW